MKALGLSGDPRGFELLVAASTDAKDEFDRENAITALGILGDRRAVAPLIHALRSSHEKASALLSELRIELRQKQFDKAKVRSRALQSELHMNEVLVKALIQLEEVDNVDELLEVFLHSLTIIRQARAVIPSDYIKKDAFSGKVYVISTSDAIIRALGQLADVRAVEPLISVLESASLFVDEGKAAAEALGNLGDKRACDPLLKLAKTPYMLISHSEAKVWFAAIEALRQLGDHRVVGEVSEKCMLIMNSDSLDLLTSTSAEHFHGREQDWQILEVSAHVLAQLGDSSTIVYLLEMVSYMDAKLWKFVMEGLKRLDDSEATALLSQALATQY